MSATVYDLCGLRLRSEIELHLPVASPTGPGADDVDVDIVRGDPTDTSELPVGEVVASLDIDDPDDDPGDDLEHPDDDADELRIAPGWWYRAVRVDDGHVVRFHRCGEFHFSADLDRVEVCPDPDGRHEILPILMAGTVGAMLLTLRGNTVLHASAVAVDGRVVAFVAPSGGGKSTLAALLCKQGAELVTDDVLVVDPGPPVRCAGGAIELRLRAKAAPLADGAQGSSRSTADGRTAFAPGDARLGLLPLAAIVMPWPSREANEIEVTELSGAERLLTLMDSPRVFGWTDGAVLARDLSTLGQVVNQVPVVEVTVPWGPPFDPSDVAGLLDLARTG